jgi:predicted dithiol-disulfide oxidoreductase (DUF899 family)
MADELARQRRELPWVPVEKEYRFATDEGMRTLAQLFDGRSQLLIYHFMFGPSWEAGCPVCSSIANTINGVLPHLHARGVTMFLVSHAPLEKLQAYKRRMGWVVPWASSFDSDFNFDFDVSFTDQQVKEFMGPVRDSGSLPTVSQNAASTGTDEKGYLSEGPGASVFALADRVVYHTYSTYGRGLEFVNGLLRDPRPGAQRTRRAPFAPDLDPETRRVPPQVTRAEGCARCRSGEN